MFLKDTCLTHYFQLCLSTSTVTGTNVENLYKYANDFFIFSIKSEYRINSQFTEEGLNLKSRYSIKNHALGRIPIKIRISAIDYY